jgi:IS5 family transposase
MPARATPRDITNPPSVSNYLVPVPDTDFREFLAEVEQLARLAPEILVQIEDDLDAHARHKKHLREEDRRFYESQTAELPALEIVAREMAAEDLHLGVGRPRMPAFLVYVFVMIRGFLGSLSSKPSRRFLLESMSLHDFLQSRGERLPAVTTILENVNAVSAESRDLILRKQLEHVLEEGLDDLLKQTQDSTAVKANSAWPTDGKILIGLLGRAYRLGQKLDLFGLENFPKGWVARWLKEMEQLEFEICLNAGKANSRRKMKKSYLQLLKRARKAAAALEWELAGLKENLRLESLPPSRRAMLQQVLERIGNDLSDARRVADYAEERVFRDQSLASTEKILSLSDASAAFIKKGGREPVIGYKPQLVRSAQGLITSVLIPEGNAADSAQLVPAIVDSIQRTGVIPKEVSTDDGYASAKGRRQLLDLGVRIVSISGAKGKKLTDPEDWESEAYREARRNRSAVESLMFTIKEGFEFGELGRRGIAAVRAELTEKVLAYNCCRIILLKQRKREERKKAA